MSNMYDILKKFDAVEQKTRLNECGDMPAPAPTTPVTVNLTAPTAQDMAQILRALTNIESGAKMPMPMPASSMAQAAGAMEAEHDEGILGGVAGAALGGAVGGIPGAMAGGYLGSKVDEEMDPQAIMGQIRKMAKGVEQSPDKRAHMAFAQEVESDLIYLFQHFQQNMNTKHAEAVRGLIRQNKAAQKSPDLRNANNIVEVLYGLMRGTDEAYANEPDEEYADHKFMTKDLSGGINRQKNMYPPAAKGDNPMAVEASGLSPVYIQHLTQMFSNKETLSKREVAKAKEIIRRLTINDIKTLAKANIPHLSQIATHYIRHNTPGGMVRQMEGDGVSDQERNPNLWRDHYASQKANRRSSSSATDDYWIAKDKAAGLPMDPSDIRKRKKEREMEFWETTSIKDRLWAALNEKKSKPDFLDMDKDGNKKEPMKKAIKDKKVKEAAKPDFLDMDKDGNKKEPMKKAVADKKKNPFGNKK